VAEPGSLQRGRAETILLVEDDELASRTTRRLLEMLDYAVQVAGRGDEALALIEAGAQFDLLLTDVLLPGLDGPELFRRAARQRPSLPVVFMSGYAADLLVEKGVSDAGAVFLQKPFSHAELALKIRAALDIKRG
jgi:CheY-like chemotaxis protein